MNMTQWPQDVVDARRELEKARGNRLYWEGMVSRGQAKLFQYQLKAGCGQEWFAQRVPGVEGKLFQDVNELERAIGVVEHLKAEVENREYFARLDVLMAGAMAGDPGEFGEHTTVVAV